MKPLLWREDVNPDTLDTVLDKIPLLRAAGVVKTTVSVGSCQPQ